MIIKREDAGRLGVFLFGTTVKNQEGLAATHALHDAPIGGLVFYVVLSAKEA